VDRISSNEKRVSLRDFAYVIFRKKWVILGVLLSTVIPVTIYAIRIPSTYEAKSTVLVKPGRENIYVSPVGAPEGALPPTMVRRVVELINSEIEILKTRVLIKKVIEKMGVARLFPELGFDNVQATPAENMEPGVMEGAVDRVLRSLTVGRVPDTDVIEVKFRSHDPLVATDFVNSIMLLYRERHLEVHQSEEAYDFFRAQSNQLEQQLSSAARRLAEFRKNYGIVSFDQLKQLTLEQYSAVSAKKLENETALKETQKRIEKLKQEFSHTSEQTYLSQSEFTDSETTANLREKLTSMELQKVELMTKYKPTDYRIVTLDETIAKVRELLARQDKEFHGTISTGVDPFFRKLQEELFLEETNLVALATRAEETEKEVVTYGQELERLSRLEPQLRALEREVGIHEQNYKLYLTKFEESRVSDAMDAAKMVSVSVLEPATTPSKPLPVSKTLYVFVAFCLGGIAGLGLAFLLEYLDHSFKVPEDIEENLGVRLLSTIDDLPARRKEDLDSLVASPKLPLHYQALKSNVVMLAKEKGIKLLCVCSPTSKEGASYVALNLAASFAKDDGQRVIWIDSNLRSSHLNGVFNLPVSPGLVEVVNDGVSIREAVQEQPISGLPNLFILSSGASPYETRIRLGHLRRGAC
jgi:uncharacterized protein involved in exopolysaccharide biosynthesis